MVIVMENIEVFVHVDKQGRLVIPSKMRRNLGVTDGGDVSLKLNGDRVVIEARRDKDIERKSDEWLQTVLKTRATIFSDDSEAEDESWKWMSREYARRKLGLHH